MTGKFRSYHKWTEEEDNLLRGEIGYGDIQTMAQKFNCSPSSVSIRRKILRQRDAESGADLEPWNKKPKILANQQQNILAVTSRPSFFEEDLGKLMRGSR